MWCGVCVCVCIRECPTLGPWVNIQSCICYMPHQFRYLYNIMQHSGRHREREREGERRFNVSDVNSSLLHNLHCTCMIERMSVCVCVYLYDRAYKCVCVGVHLQIWCFSCDGRIHGVCGCIRECPMCA